MSGQIRLGYSLNTVEPVIFASILRVFGRSTLTWEFLRSFYVSDLMIVTYPDEYRAPEVLVALQRLQEKLLIDLEATAYVMKEKDGKVQLQQTVLLTKIGATSGLGMQPGRNLQNGNSALFVFVRGATADKVLAEINQYGGAVLHLHSSLTRETEARLQSALAARQRV